VDRACAAPSGDDMVAFIRVTNKPRKTLTSVHSSVASVGAMNLVTNSFRFRRVDSGSTGA
jgi:hypothetical protein